MMSSKGRKFSSLRLLLLFLLLNGALSLLFVNGATPSADELAAKKYMEHRVWECERNGAHCQRLFPAYRDNKCGFPAEAYNCRQGWYEALNGTCLSMPDNCHYVSKGNRELTECLGCSIEDKPSGGKTMLGCVDQQATCTRDYRDDINCSEKRHICAKGYYRTPDNQCRENQALQADKSYAKPGCEDILKRVFYACPPNSEPKCVSGNVGVDGEFCMNIGEVHERPPMRHLRILRSSQMQNNQEEEEECRHTCVCKPGYVFEDNTGSGGCISKEQCSRRGQASFPQN